MAKAVRMSDIAERLHVSIVTVSKALAGKDGVSEELRQEILQLSEQKVQAGSNGKDVYPGHCVVIPIYRKGTVVLLELV